ncbi:MAG: ATP-binding cassette domain-containing protein [Candidatus Omnitrophota bacterium]
MININNLSKCYGERVLFDNVNLSINPGEKIGLVGPNGAGKTTLFSLILEETEPSCGNITVKSGIRIGYLPQESKFDSKQTVLGELLKGDDKIVSLIKEKEALEHNSGAASSRYGEILHELEVLDYFGLEYKAKRILHGLGFKEDDFNKPVCQLSGGWQMRTLLAKLLTLHFDLLLLDEPTNFLDLSAALWFKDYLARFKGTFIMISHDKDYLDEVANYTLIFENSKLAKVKGNYEHFRRIIEEKRSFLLKKNKEQQKKRKQLQDFINRFHAQPNKASQVRAKRKMLEMMEEIVVPEDRIESIRNFNFPKTKRCGHQLINLKEIDKSYGDNCVYKNFNFEIVRNEKAVLVGENGAGKSTLLKILAGEADIDKGTRLAGYGVETGYFSQARMDVLNPYNDVLEEALSVAGDSLAPEAVRTILGAFLFRGDDVYKSVQILSGGEKSRLILAKLLINPPNFLLLDEPTTHLDVDAVEALIRALKVYDGAFVAISHDIHFVRSVANCVFEVKDGQVTKFPGNFDYYLEARAKIPHKHSHASGETKDKYISAKERRSEQAQIRKNEKEKRKMHNENLSKRIKKMRKEKESLETSRYAKKRVLDSRCKHSDREVFNKYSSELDKIDIKIAKIDADIEKLKNNFYKKPNTGTYE